jgi:hypothetical protein
MDWKKPLAPWFLSCRNGQSKNRTAQIPVPHFALSCENMFAQSINRTETFHVKQFCPIPCGKSDNILQ